MVKVNNKGYLERILPDDGKTNCRNWWLVKPAGNKGKVHINVILFPKKYLGKRVRFKVEIIADLKEKVRDKK